MLKIIYFMLINWHYNNLLVSYFRINKTQELVIKKFKTYIKSCYIYLSLKVIYYKFYSNLQSLSILIYQ